MRALIGRHLPRLVFLLALVPGLALTFVLHQSGERREQAEFERAAELAIDRIVSRLDRHVVVLRAARGLLSATRGGMSRDEFVRFLASVDITGDLSGVQGVGFARMLGRQDASVAMDDILRHYDLAIAVHPEGEQPWITPIVLLEPQNDRNLAALGFDMYSDGTRRSAMDHAIASGDAQMSGPVELVQEITSEKQTGFLIYLPFQTSERPAGTVGSPVAGFVYAPFRGGDLIRAALAEGMDLPLSLRVVDTGAPSTPLFDSLAASDAMSRTLSSTVAILGRQWQFEFLASHDAADGARFVESLVLALTSILFAAAAAYAVASRQAEASQARELARVAAREAEFRAITLLEMKHRIKNHIARIQSIARQSARGATDVKAFTTAFDARLHSMSSLQEILAGTVAAKAGVREILGQELRQCREAAQVDAMLDGPDVQLDERKAQAFAILVHELVTNAMKYGGLSGDDATVQITWSKRPGPTGEELAFDWVETAPGIPPANGRPAGFGSRLIDASLKGELSGSIERDYSAGRLHIRFAFPLGS